MTQPLINRSINNEIYASALSSLWEYFWEVYPQSYALKEDVDAWEICLRNGAFYQGVQQRLHEVIGDEWHCYAANNSIEPEDIGASAVVEDCMRSIRSFSDAMKRQAQAIFRGWTAQLITGRRKWCRLNGHWGNWWCPTAIEHVDQRRFKIVPKRFTDKRGVKRVKGELYISTIPRTLAERHKSGPEEFYRYGYTKVDHPEHFLTTVYDDEESRVKFGRGIMDTLYFYVWSDQIVLREGLQALERYAQGIPIGYVDATAAGNTDQDSEAERNAMETQLHRMKGRGVFVTDSRNKVEILGLTGQGHQLVADWRDYIDNKIIGVATGAILSSGVGSDVGSNARDKTGAEIQSRIVIFDRNKLSEDVTAGIIELIWKLNRPQLEQAGLGHSARPEFKLIARRNYDANQAVERVKLAREAGIDLPEDEVYEQIGFSQPKPGQKVLKGQAAPAQGAPGMPGMGNPFGPPQPVATPPGQPAPIPEKPAPPALTPVRPVARFPIPIPTAPPAGTSEGLQLALDKAKKTGGLTADLAIMHSFVEQAEEAARRGEMSPIRAALGHADARMEQVRRQLPGELSLKLESSFIKVWSAASCEVAANTQIPLGELRVEVAQVFDTVTEGGSSLLRSSEAKARERLTQENSNDTADQIVSMLKEEKGKSQSAETMVLARILNSVERLASGDDTEEE